MLLELLEITVMAGNREEALANEFKATTGDGTLRRSEGGFPNFLLPLVNFDALLAQAAAESPQPGLVN